ncbi:hypothetical protein HUE87_09020 [Candidatus Sulfurimonas marisnigri]|uniref:Uncharacterized protein n=1 Tax=Candidatus Sulfurimonas marisnigri TaxID=2740405 RepID=A0A7S7RP58_9BACT|nr:hypothetical protein [Candidatus Sulfurimonas marisnigri]QOY54027.1 hypothetical protein HUE87_09020 [Candidatus Sulfurimonas marisnigri]
MEENIYRNEPPYNDEYELDFLDEEHDRNEPPHNDEYEDIESPNYYEYEDEDEDEVQIFNKHSVKGDSSGRIAEMEKLFRQALLRDCADEDEDIDNNENQQNKSNAIEPLSDEKNDVPQKFNSQNSEYVEAEIIETQKNSMPVTIASNMQMLHTSSPIQKAHDKGIATYNNSMATHYAKENAQRDISFTELAKFSPLEGKSRFLVEQINKNDLCLWMYKDLYYYKAAKNATLSKGDKNYISGIISRRLNKATRIVSVKDIKKEDKIIHDQIEQYIFEYHIDIVDNEVFEPKEEEFFIKDGVWYRNEFLYTQYLKKRFDNINNTSKIYDGFVIDFLENITNEFNQDNDDKPFTRAILNWLSYFFQKMESLHIALVLNGSKRIADIFWKKLIQKIFDSEAYSVTIDDDVLNKPIEEIVKDKIFFRIVDFSPTKKNIDKINQLLEAILIDKYVSSVVSGKTVKVPVYGQLLISADETISYMDEHFDLFEYINIENEEQVIINLAGSKPLLQLKFNDEAIDIFSTYLSFWNKNANIDSIAVVSKFNTQNNMLSEAKKENFEDKILNFIQAIKQKDINYFTKLKDSELYNSLTSSFEKNCVIRKHLLDYFKAVNDSEVFKSNTTFLEVLKEKDELFTQEVDKLKAIDENRVEQVLFNGNPTYSEAKNEKLLKITEYTLPEDITVPKNHILKSKSKKQRFEYKYEDIETANIMYEKYDADKKEEKES